jgi:hypothetical protein
MDCPIEYEAHRVGKDAHHEGVAMAVTTDAQP